MGDDDDEGGPILCSVIDCPECGAAVIAELGGTVTGCTDHGGEGKR